MSVNEETNLGFFQGLMNKVQAFFSSEEEEEEIEMDDEVLFAFTEENVLEFVKDFVKEEDDLMCISFAMDNDFTEPEGYEMYGCNGPFITAEEANETRGIQEASDFKDAYLVMHNYYLKPKITVDSGMITGFPPTFNYPSEEDFILESFSETEATVRVEGKTPCLFTVKKDAAEEEGKIVTSIMQSIQYVGDVERLDY